MEIIAAVTGLVVLVLLGLLLWKLSALEKKVTEMSGEERSIKQLIEQLDKLQKAIESEIKESRQETIRYITENFRNLADILSGSQKQIAEIQDKRLADLNQQLTQRNDTLQKTVTDMLKHINDTMESRLLSMQRDNEKKLELMRETVDEKLQKTLEDRISQSFKLVSERLEQVYKGLGEMQNLASGVGDLKKVLSNVKTRGILGEIQLGSILEQILTPDQYETNIPMKKGSSERVEYAIKLPGDDDGVVYLPIDAKFPADAYAKLADAYETGDVKEIDAAATHLERMIKSFAKDIRDKYVSPPYTTDFGIMFLPFEGLYAEVVRRGMVETLQRDYKINIAGPSTMAALLNSLQMGFRTLAIQKHSSKVWDVLGAVKTEFDKFGSVLEATQKRINQANAELDKLIGTRTRLIRSKLRSVTALPEESSQEILGIEEEPEDLPDREEEEQ
ncbi:MAG: DNA recombination protein RmuC [Bacillota bacterium]|nr:DNA recombination protein RmuC [Bacillota bacterium]